jgi:hypothetical protein
MKKYLLFFLLLLYFANSTSSQNTIPNADFETWIDDNHTQSWYGLYLDLIISQIYTLSKSTDAQNGNFSAQVETKDATLMALPGIASLAEMNLDILGGGLTFSSAGAPINVRPTKVSGYFKYLQVNSDTAMIAVVLTKWNSVSNTRDTLGLFGSLMNTAYTNYTPFTINISVSQTPDSMNILLVSSGGNSPQIGSILIVDNLSMEFLPNTDIQPIVPLGASAFPNPANDYIMFSVPDEGQSFLRMYDVTGKLVYENMFSEKSFSVDVSKFSSGIYQVIIQNNRNTYTHKTYINR